MTALILFVIVFVAVVVISDKTKTNMGVLCILGSFLLGGWYAGTDPNTIVNYFPVRVLSTLFITIVFFGYVNQTKSFEGLVQRILYATKGKTSLYPWALFVASFAICAVGGNDALPIIISPIAFAVVGATGMNPLMGVLVGYLGSAAMGMAPWTPGGQVFSGMMSTGAGEKSMTAVITAVVITLIGSALLLAVYYFRFGCHKLKATDFVIEKPQPFNRDQKIALTVLVVVMLLVLIPGVLKNYVSGDLKTVFTWMGNHMGIKQLCLIGVLIFAFLKVGDGRKVMNEMVPWGVIMNIGGATMLIQCANDLGIIELVGSVASTAIPKALMPAVCVLVAGLLSFVSNAMVILPLFSPIAAAMAQISGLSPVMLCSCLLIGCISTGLSPVSMGGSLHSLGANKEQREAIWGPQWFAAAAALTMYTLLALVGVIPFIANLLGC